MATITKQGQKGNLTKLDLDYEGTKDGEDQVRNYLEIVQQKLGFTPNVLAAFAKFPKQFEGFTKLYNALMLGESCLLYTSPSPRDSYGSRLASSG